MELGLTGLAYANNISSFVGMMVLFIIISSKHLQTLTPLTT